MMQMQDNNSGDSCDEEAYIAVRGSSNARTQ